MSSTEKQPNGEIQTPRGFPFLLAIIVGAVALIVVVVVAPTLGAINSDGTTGPAPEVALTLWLVIGSAVLLLMIMAVALLSNYVIKNRAIPTALGLPEGSVSAIIALMLLLIFAISSVFLFNQIRAGEGDGFISSGLTIEGLRSLPQERILEASVENPSETNAALRTYRVRLAAAHTDSIEFAKASALTIGTLLTAVAGFYFGQRATQSGARLSERPERRQFRVRR
jgi:hypothetical protein